MSAKGKRNIELNPLTIFMNCDKMVLIQFREDDYYQTHT